MDTTDNEIDFDLNLGLFWAIGLPIQTTGIVGNLAIILATFRTGSNLKQKSNYIIAFLAFNDLVSSFIGYVVSFPTILEWIICFQILILYYISNGSIAISTCFYTISFYLFSLNTGAALLLVVGIDRLLSLSMQFRFVFWFAIISVGKKSSQLDKQLSMMQIWRLEDEEVCFTHVLTCGHI